MTQCSRAARGQPACLWLAVFLLAAPISSAPAQARYRVVREESFRQEPTAQGKVLATIPAGVEVTGLQTRDDWTEVALEGWIWSASVGRTARDGHNLAVTSGRGENLRSAPNGGVVARLLQGFLMDEVSRAGAWVRARRTGWIPAGATAPIGGPGEQVTANPAPADSVDPPADGGEGPRPAAALDRAVVARSTPLADSPDGTSRGTIDTGATVRVLARSGEWVRVQTEGWVRESDLRPGSNGVLTGVTASEVRASPGDFENRMVQWLLQYLSVATADELRPEIPLGRRYMLARGPLPEAGFIYVTLTSEQLREVERLPPLAQLVVVARVRVARSKYLGNPVVELVEMQVKEP